MAVSEVSETVGGDRDGLGMWVLRDVLLGAGFALFLWVSHTWQGGAVSAWAAVVVSVLGFVVAYASCYVMHEWGHLAGARVAGARLPLGSCRGVLLGLFDTRAHTRKQFQSMSIGGVAFYLLTAALFVTFAVLFADSVVFLAGAVGGIAFVAQSLAVDLPIIWRVAGGEDVTQAATTGAAPAVILRRTWQSWLCVAGVAAIIYGV